ncbi:hypothetical protein PR202_ga31491 [Eleusine coracana subsp. coracana]|uniref:Uncharacterized protein n=1 Tax=Eleusine coracana subsp. coracana TaxID=191504 RepID=A0AAV5DQC7_ELECO|nr:hypothetical protein PR202_ga31491 [Eleusine coracana subsp. coracana]
MGLLPVDIRLIVGIDHVSGAFVQQYYHILHEKPEQVHKFYQDSSILGRPEPNGTMGSVTTQAGNLSSEQAINETIMSMDFRNCLIEIETADAQLSHKGGVLIVVTGYLTPSEGVCRKFTQSFFLAPQESGGYFVLNDVLRFISERQPVEINQVVTRENESSQIAISASETCSALPEPTAAGMTLNSDHVTVENNVTERQVINPSANGEGHEGGPAVVTVARTTPAVPRQKQPKPVTKDVKVSKPVTKDVEVSKPVTKDVEVPVQSSAKPTQDNETTASDGIVAENNSLRNDHGYSIFVRNLPFHAHIDLVEVEFSKFSAVKPGGVEVVHHQLDGFCFGFVEFESQQSMQAAIKASPILIGDNVVLVEKKKAPTRVTRSGGYPCSDSGGGVRFQAGRGVYRGDNFGGQGGGYANNANYRGGDNFNHRNEGRDNYNRRNDGGENYNCRRNIGENYNHRNDGAENYNRRNDGGQNYNRSNDGGERRGDAGENYNRRNDGSENFNRRGDGVENNNRRGNIGESYSRRNEGGENYNRRGDGGENNRWGNMVARTTIAGMMVARTTVTGMMAEGTITGGMMAEGTITAGMTVVRTSSGGTSKIRTSSLEVVDRGHHQGMGITRTARNSSHLVRSRMATGGLLVSVDPSKHQVLLRGITR